MNKQLKRSDLHHLNSSNKAIIMKGKSDITSENKDYLILNSDYMLFIRMTL